MKKERIKTIEVETNELGYILKVPISPKGLVVLFPSFGSGVIKTDVETKIDDKCFIEGYASLIIDYKHDFFLDEPNFVKINNLVNTILDKNNIPSRNLFIGGFSVGGNIALTYCIWFNKLKRVNNKPLGIFVGDSPVDLYGLYNSQVKAIEKSTSTDVAIDEGKFIVDYLKENLGDPKKSIDKYYKYSPFINKDIDKSNIKFLKDYHIHFYSEPDLKWFKEVFDYDNYEDINSFKIERFKEELDKISTKNIRYTKTKNKGFRDNLKNPHSWSIINENDFYKWMLECQNQSELPNDKSNLN